MSDLRHCDGSGIQLNIDILRIITKFVKDDEDEGIPCIAAISRTCKLMRFEGIKHLLSGTVKLSFIDHICSFCHFMLADKSTRLPLLKGLVLRLYKLEEDDHVGPICEVLRGLSNLHELDITLSATSSPLAVSAIPAAVGSLTSLRVLSLSELTRFTSKTSNPIFATTLRNAQAPLVSLSIDFGFYVEDGQAARVRYNRKRDPIFLCSHLRTTLERLQVYGALKLVVWPGRAYEYPRLKQLVLPLYDAFRPYLKPFIISFPQLRDLQYGGEYNSHTRHRHNEDILRMRFMNKRTPQEWRATNERDQDAIGRSWPMLDSFKGAIIGAYATGLACPVAKVHLLSTGGRRTTELAMLSVVLSDWRPSFLRLSTKVYRARGYIPILPSSSSGWGESLGTLELRLNIVDDRFDFPEFFEHLGQMLSTLPVTSLRVEFCCLNSRTQYMEHRHPPLDPFEGEECEEIDDYGPDAFCFMQDALLHEDLHQRVRECMHAAPTLRRTTLVWGRCWTSIPNRVICVDLDNVPHAWDRPGDDSDGWDKPDRDW